RARGAGRTRVLFIHALRNAAGPAVTLVGLGLPGLVGGSLVIEVLFAWPGMGRIAYEAILARDMPVVAGTVTLAAAVTLGASLLSDLLYVVADPRVVLPGSPTRTGVSS
ncbi:MAG TPA: ABC transporter permease, partial [Patescibacteria group bacterium]|nr:ABC transporter permease [Patescibacteria group bacterium]